MAGHPLLKETEVAILEHLAAGLTAKEVEFKIKSNKDRVQSALNFMKRLSNTRNTTSLIAHAVRQGWIE